MNFLYILEENESGPSGVVSVVKNKIINWSESDSIYLLINKDHWAFKEFSKIKKKNFKIIKLKFSTSNEVNLFFKKKINFLLISKILRLILLPYEILINLRVFFYLRQIIKSNSINIIFNHNGGWPGGILNRIGLLSSFGHDIKNYLIIHNYPVKKNFFNFLFIKLNDFFVYLIKPKIITVSKSCRKDLILCNHFSKIQVIYNGIDGNLIKSKQMNLRSKKIIISYFGKIQERKGLHLLVQALNEIKSKNIVLCIYGDGDNDYKKKLILMNIQRNFDLIFYKPVPDITKFLLITDIVVLPSIKYESFGMILIEAMRQKIPVICSDSGGMKEIVKNNINGLIFKNNNINDLKKKVLILINSKIKRKKFGKKGYSTFKNKFTNKIFIKEYQKLSYGK